MKSDKEEAFFPMWFVFTKKWENCNRFSVSSPFLDKTMIKEGTLAIAL